MNIPKRYEHAKWEDVHENIRPQIEKLRETRKGLYIYGAVGCGKTHAAYAIYKHMVEEMKLTVRFHNTTELMFDIKKDFDRTNYDKARWDEKLSDFRGVLILDDIGTERMTDFVAETFYLIINKRYNEMLPTIFTSNLEIGELADKIGDKTASRVVEMCDLVFLTGDDRRLLAAKSKHNG